MNMKNVQGHSLFACRDSTRASTCKPSKHVHTQQCPTTIVEVKQQVDKKKDRPNTRALQTAIQTTHTQTHIHEHNAREFTHAPNHHHRTYIALPMRTRHVEPNPSHLVEVPRGSQEKTAPTTSSPLQLVASSTRITPYGPVSWCLHVAHLAKLRSTPQVLLYPESRVLGSDDHDFLRGDCGRKI